MISRFNLAGRIYQLRLKDKGDPERGIIVHPVDGVPLGDLLNQYPSRQTDPEISLGTFTATHAVRPIIVR